MIDIGISELPRQERIKQLSTHINALIGSVTGEKTHRSYSSTAADHTIDRSKLSDIQQDKIDYIRRNFTPEEAVASIMEFPPMVFVDMGDKEEKLAAIQPKNPITNKPPLHFEVDTARQVTFVDENLYGLQTASALESCINVCKNYLELPTRNDGFTNHDQRRDWERGVGEVLEMIGRSWNEEFLKFWNFSRYAKNKQTPVINYPEILTHTPGLELPERLQIKFDDITAKMRKGRELFLAGKLDEGIGMIAQECGRVIHEFTKEKAAMDKLTSEMFNSLTESLSKRNPIANGKALATEFNPAEAKAIQFLKENADPTDLAFLVLDNPPSVTAIPDNNQPEQTITIKPEQIISTYPKPDEQAAGKKRLVLHAGSNITEQEDIKTTVGFIQKFLLMPKRKDGFADHDNRRLWVKGVERVMGLIDGNRFGFVFNTIWNNNRYSGGARGLALTGAQQLMDMRLPPYTREEISSAVIQMKQGQELFERQEVESGTDMITQAAIRVVDNF